MKDKYYSVHVLLSSGVQPDGDSVEELYLDIKIDEAFVRHECGKISILLLVEKKEQFINFNPLQTSNGYAG
jgi:hypothetical protein